MARQFGYYINLDERGSFYADVRDETGESIFEIRSEGDGTLALIEDGFMRHKTDLGGLQEHLVSLGVIGPKDEILAMQDFERRIGASR